MCRSYECHTEKEWADMREINRVINLPQSLNLAGNIHVDDPDSGAARQAEACKRCVNRYLASIRQITSGAILIQSRQFGGLSNWPK